MTNFIVYHLYRMFLNWAASSEFGTYRLCEQRRFRRAYASAQSRQNLRCSLIQAVSQEEPSDRKPDPWPIWMAGNAQLKFVMTECSKTQIRLMRPNCLWLYSHSVRDLTSHRRWPFRWRHREVKNTMVFRKLTSIYRITLAVTKTVIS